MADMGQGEIRDPHGIEASLVPNDEVIISGGSPHVDAGGSPLRLVKT